MRRTCLSLILVFGMHSVAGVARARDAQDVAPNGPPLANPAATLRLLQSPAAQADLRLTAQQRQAVKLLAGEVAATMRPLENQNARQRAAAAKRAATTLRSADLKLRKILSSTQLQRIDQIGFQYPTGPQYLVQPRLAARLHLTPQQVLMVDQLTARSQAAWEQYQSTLVPGENTAAARYQFLRASEAQTADLVLSDQQAAALRDAMGVPFNWSEMAGR